MPTRSVLTLLLALAAGGCALPGRDLAPATPQRPTLSSDTNTAAQGTFEVEAGAVIDDDSSWATPAALRFGAGPATEFILGWTPLLHVDGGGADETGIGDVALGARHRVRDETPEHPSLAFQAVAKLPTANDDNGLGSGENDVFLAAIASKALGDVSLTAFGQLDLLGDPTGGVDLGTSLALAAGTSLSGELGLFGELGGSLVPDEDLEDVGAIVGLAWTPHPDLVLDVAVRAGLSDDASDFQLLFGLTRNLGARPATPTRTTGTR